MAPPPVTVRLNAVNRVRAHQRQWIEATRAAVAAGAPFAICNGDEAEEIFLALGIPVLAINYWNFLIAAQGSVGHFESVLHGRGYPGKHFFALGLASSLAPEQAPWGGLPRPTIICGSGRSEAERRVTELWARSTNAHFFPMDFSFPGEHVSEIPRDWWNLTQDHWDQLVDPKRLAYRTDQERRLIGFLEQVTGRRFGVGDLLVCMERVNRQMAYWAEAGRLIAETRPCPVHMRDQLSIYQAMWHRGTELGIEMLRDYRDEIRARAQAGTGGYAREKIRLFYSGEMPAWSQWAEETFGAVTVANAYSGVPDLYARRILDGDPLRTLAGRHLFLFAFNPEWMAHIVTRFNCDAAVVVEPYMDRYAAGLSAERQAVEAAGVPYLALPRDADDADTRERLGNFLAGLG